MVHEPIKSGQVGRRLSLRAKSMAMRLIPGPIHFKPSWSDVSVLNNGI
jgi:hypothetical protein